MTLARQLMYGPLPPIRALLLMAACAVVLVVTVGALLYPRDPVTPDVLPLVATVAPAGDAGSIVTSESTFGVGGGAGGCLAPVRRGASSMEICWQAYRLLNEEDADQDYYGLEISATLHGEESGATWAVVQVHPLAGAAGFAGGQQVELAPGSCRYVTLRSEAIGPQRSVLACEQWMSGQVTHQGQEDDARTTWKCGSCLSGMVGDRDLPLVQLVTVPTGVVPSWQLSADFGG